MGGPQIQNPRILSAEGQEQLFISASKGNEQPKRIIADNNDASRHLAEILQSTQNIVGIISFRKLMKMSFPGLIFDDFYNFMTQVHPSRHSVQVGTYIAKNWFTLDYLGPEVYSRFTKTPPFYTKADSFFAEVFSASGGNIFTGQWQGVYFPGTNHIIVAPLLLGNEKGHVEGVLAHETLHYASWLGGGTIVRWKDNQGKATVKGKIGWFHEGLTELLARQLCIEHGFKDSSNSTAYDVGVTFSLYIQKIVDKDSLKQAYLSGDFTTVRRVVNERLGAGSFEEIMGRERGAEALEAITTKFEKAKIDYSEWKKEAKKLGGI